MMNVAETVHGTRGVKMTGCVPTTAANTGDMRQNMEITATNMKRGDSDE